MCRIQKLSSPVVQSSNPVQWMDTPNFKVVNLLWIIIISKIKFSQSFHQYFCTCVNNLSNTMDVLEISLSFKYNQQWNSKMLISRIETKSMGTSKLYLATCSYGFSVVPTHCTLYICIATYMLNHANLIVNDNIIYYVVRLL